MTVLVAVWKTATLLVCEITVTCGVNGFAVDNFPGTSCMLKTAAAGAAELFALAELPGAGLILGELTLPVNCWLLETGGDGLTVTFADGDGKLFCPLAPPSKVLLKN